MLRVRREPGSAFCKSVGRSSGPLAPPPGPQRLWSARPEYACSLLIAPRLEDAHCGRVIRQGNMGKFYRTRDNRVGPLVLPQNGRAGLAQRDVKGWERSFFNPLLREVVSCRGRNILGIICPPIKGWVYKFTSGDLAPWPANPHISQTGGQTRKQENFATITQPIQTKSPSD